MSLSVDQIRRLNVMCPVADRVQLGTLLSALETQLNRDYDLVFPLPGTLGADVGADGDGTLVGDLALKNPGDATYDGVVAQYDANGSPRVTDYTTEAANATANDVLPFPTSPAQYDHAAFAAAVKFFGLLVNITTQANMSATTVWKYSGPSGALSALTPLFDASSALQVAGTGWKLMTFEPPADWTAVAMADTLLDERYMVICQISAFASSTTEPLIGQMKFVHAVGDGIPAPRTGAVSKLVFNFNTVSGSTANSEFMLINVTQGTWTFFTKTKATQFEEVAGALAVTAGDELVLCQVSEDGSTEFADGFVNVIVTPTAV